MFIFCNLRTPGNLGSSSIEDHLWIPVTFSPLPTPQHLLIFYKYDIFAAVSFKLGERKDHDEELWSLKMEPGLTRLQARLPGHRSFRSASEEAPWLGRARFSESFWSNPKKKIGWWFCFSRLSISSVSYEPTVNILLWFERKYNAKCNSLSESWKLV